MCDRTKGLIKDCFNVRRDPNAPPVETPRFIKVSFEKGAYATDIRKVLAENSVKG